jgi:L-malate glycosyltransferase
VHVVVVGDGELRREYEAEAASLGLQSRVHFLGARSQRDLPEALRACDVVALPSLVPEAFPLTVVEALACGVPVVASDCPGVRSMAGEMSGLLTVPPNNPSRLAEAINRLFVDEPLRHQLGEAGRRFVEEHYGWPTIAGNLEGIYQEVLAHVHVSDQLKPRKA